MNKNFLMGADDRLRRTKSSKRIQSHISSSLKHSLLKLAIRQAFDYYNTFTSKSVEVNEDQLAEEYTEELQDAVSLGLFKDGGIKEKDHLNLWCLGRVLLPEVYIESGVFIGSSLHAMSKVPSLKQIIGIDPNLKKLKKSLKDIPFAKFIDDKDFSEIDFEKFAPKSLTYFDDHINTAQRIIQAHQKGLKYLLFDDSTGIEGVCQRLYPAIPTIPMIMTWENYDLEEELTWTFVSPQSKSLKGLVKMLLKPRITRVSLKIDENFQSQCKLAKGLIKKFGKIPDLGDYIPQLFPEGTIDTSKYLLELDLEKEI